VDTTEILKRLDYLESREAIRQLITTYGIACDEHDMETLMNCFTEDAVYGSPNGAMVATGKSEIEDMFVNAFMVRGAGFHWTHDIMITMDDQNPDNASGLVCSHAETTPGGIHSIASMKYFDEYRRENGKWFFSKRSINMLYYVPVSEYPDSLKRINRVFMGEEWHPADFPESTESYQNFSEKYVEK